MYHIFFNVRVIVVINVVAISYVHFFIIIVVMLILIKGWDVPVMGTAMITAIFFQLSLQFMINIKMIVFFFID